MHNLLTFDVQLLMYGSSNSPFLIPLISCISLLLSSSLSLITIFLGEANSKYNDKLNSKQFKVFVGKGNRKRRGKRGLEGRKAI